MTCDSLNRWLNKNQSKYGKFDIYNVRMGNDSFTKKSNNCDGIIAITSIVLTRVHTLFNKTTTISHR